MKKIKTLLLFSAFLFIFFFSLTTKASAATYYVSPSGSGTAYTQTNPGSFKTALSIAQAGDTILLTDGTYQDTSVSYTSYDSWLRAFSPARSGMADNPITIRAVNALRAIITPPNSYYTTNYESTPNVASIGIDEKSYIVIDGLRVQGGIGIGGQDGGGVGNVIQNCEVTGGFVQGTDRSLHYGIVLAPGTSYNTVRNNYVHDINPVDGGYESHNGGGIMLLNVSGKTIHHNVIEYNTVDAENLGTVFGTKGGGCNDNIWRYNFGKNASGSAFIEMGSTGGTTWDSFRNKIHNNVIINTPIFLEGYHSGSDWDIYNNTFYNSSNTNVIFFKATWVGGNTPTDSRPCKNNNFHNNLAYNGSRGTDVECCALSAWQNVYYASSDYNQFYNYTNWYKANSTYGSLSTWSSSTGYDTHSSTNNPNFVNSSGTFSLSSDFKRSSYPADGVGGNYSTVKGAYVTGSETIGYSGSQAVSTICTSFTYSSWSACTNGTQTRTIISQSPSGCVGGVPTLTQNCTSVDTTPPAISGGSPSGTLNSGTAQTTLSVTTNEAAICRYARSAGTDYNSMIAFSSTGGTTHTATISVVGGNTYTYYVKCQDRGGYTNATDYTVTFSVAASTQTTCTSFAYSSWSVCSGNTQTRTVTSSYPSGCIGGTPVLTQNCNSNTGSVTCETTPGNCYYVSPNGSDNNSGSFSSPWLTVSKAVQTAVAGDIVYFRDGNYTITSMINISRGGSSNSPITFKAYQNENPLIISNGIGDVIRVQAPYWVFDGLSFNATNMPDHDKAIIGVGYDRDASHIVIKNCKFNLASAAGHDNISCIKLQSGLANYALIQNNDFQSFIETGSGYGGNGVQYLGGTNIGTKILNNNFHNNTLAIYVKHRNSDTAETGAEIAYNYFYANQEAYHGNPKNINFHDNLLVNSRINLGDNGGGSQGTNNTIQHNTLYNCGIELQNPGEGPITNSNIKDNLIMQRVGLSLWGTGSQLPHNSVLDYNIYISGSASFLEYGNSYSLSTWKTHYGGDVHSFAGTPTFTGGTSPSSIAGYTLAIGSLGKNAASDGRDMGANISLVGSSVTASTQTPVCTSFTYSTWSACSSAGTQTRTVISSSPTGCAGGSPVLIQSCTVSDTTAPTISGGTPSGTLEAGTTQVAMRVYTNEAATCRYYTSPNSTYANMANYPFTSDLGIDGIGSPTHETMITGLQNGRSYTYYIRCQDSSGNANTSDYIISFIIQSSTNNSCLSSSEHGTSTPGIACCDNTKVIKQNYPWQNWIWYNCCSSTQCADDGVCRDSGTLLPGNSAVICRNGEWVNNTTTCTSFAYSTWSDCHPNSSGSTSGTQTRTVASSYPSGCTGGSPVTSQSCTIAPVCTQYLYSTWSACSSAGIQTRTQTGTYPGGCTMTGSNLTQPVLSQACNYVAPTCTSFTYTPWSTCNANGQQARNVLTSSPANCTGGSPVLFQRCIPTCTSFIYSAWSTCSSAGNQTRAVTAKTPSNCTGGNPVISQRCTYVPTCTSFTYTPWSACNANGLQARDVATSLPNGCAGGKPILFQRCAYIPPCTSFNYSSWSSCQSNNTQYRSVLSTVPTKCAGGAPVIIQECVYDSSSNTSGTNNPTNLTVNDNSCLISPNGGNFFDPLDITITCGKNVVQATYQWDKGSAASFSGNTTVNYTADKTKILYVKYKYTYVSRGVTYTRPGVISKVFSANQNYCKVSPDGGVFAAATAINITCGHNVLKGNYQWDGGAITNFEGNTANLEYDAAKNRKLTISFTYSYQIGTKTITRIGRFIKIFTLQRCTDTEIGSVPQFKGANVYTYNTITRNYADKCSGYNLIEYYCDKNIIRSKSTRCPYGCSDGACLLQSATSSR